VFTKYNNACEGHRISDKKSFVAMGKQKLIVFENSHGPQVAHRWSTASAVN